ncbi:hypothetical protein [Pseudoblastomonas halimionae]|uniref:Uncharacterized protein n=1 Tax=Alteriqipengyuania halimionae TaxID=1926630 RepID=A0A6I4U1R3_9SPHN|nr:hypothetical protein [Alteriqipengyuania halimionae]MXP09960.1 hypothetical protein [Alteriqipengyuania halimionae]
MADWYKIPTSSRMTADEYRANINGLNIFFGAVLGFVLADAQAATMAQFVCLLLVASSLVVMIFYIAQSPYKLFYTVVTGTAIAVLPLIIETFEGPPVPKLQATLAVWAAMILMLQLVPHDKAPAAADE